MPTLSELTFGIFKDDPYSALDVEIVPSAHPHPRARIRHWVVERLRAAALVPTKISVNRATPTTMAPIVLVYLQSEDDPDVFTSAPLTYARPFQLALHVVAPEIGLPAGATMDDVLDAFSEVFESLLLLDVNDRGQWFNAEAADCQLGELLTQTEDDGEQVFTHARLQFRITYQRTPARPADQLLRRVHADWDLAPPDGRIDASDRVVFPVVGELEGTVEVLGEFTGTVGP